MELNLVTMPLAELVEDMELYPRHNVDSSHVRDLISALAMGVTLPPIVADARSKKIVDGWHRCRAYRRFYGEAVEAAVGLVEYADDKEMVLDAVRRNASHGRKLDKIDQTRSVLMLEKMGVEVVDIAVALALPEERVQRIALKVVHASSVGACGTVPGTAKIALKQSTSHLQGASLTVDQERAYASMPGASFRLLITQLCRALKVELIDLNDPKIVEGLTELRALLDEKL